MECHVLDDRLSLSGNRLRKMSLARVSDILDIEVL
jgi:hypothetical protein